MKRIPKHSIGLSRPVNPKDPKSGHATQFFEPGEPVEMSKDEAASLDAHGALEPAGGARQAKEEAPAKPKGKALIDAIAAEIGMFDPKNPEAFNRDGRPGVVHLERRLRYDITEADRDAAWESFKSANPDLFKDAAA